MGLVPDESGSKGTFSSDVLRLEISGPREDHLSVIDVPGIFKRTTSGVTTKSDMEMVGRMVHGYMKNPRSVMLTVVPANVDIATQEILEKAEELDPDGIRTLGVLTKPDLVDKGAEKNVIVLLSSSTSVGMSSATPAKLSWIGASRTVTPRKDISSQGNRRGTAWTKREWVSDLSGTVCRRFSLIIFVASSPR